MFQKEGWKKEKFLKVCGDKLVYLTRKALYEASSVDGCSEEFL